MPTQTADYHHRIAPALGVMVTGHRAKRLQQSGYEPRSSAIAEVLNAVLQRVQARAEQAFATGARVYDDVPPVYRLLTGVADGVDEMAANAAQPNGYELHVVAPGRADDASYQEPEPQRAISLGMKPTGVRSRTLRQDDYSLRDRMVLSFSDLMIAVWDGQEPFPMTSGTALAVKSALLRRIPVIWLELAQNGEAPNVWLADPARLTDRALTEIDVLDATPELLRGLFNRYALHDSGFDQQLDVWLEGLLLPFLPALNEDNEERVLRRRIARQDTTLGYLLGWLKFFVTFGGTRRPLGLFNWLLGGVLWLQVMLNPPQRSAGLHILECLNSDVRKISWQENMVSRLHGFFSGLIKLEPREAVRALRSERLETQQNHSDAPSSPIRETSLPGFFHWADAQARVFATRYRDDTWVIYYAAALAVFCAVAGAIYLWPAKEPGWYYIWVVLEFILLRFVVGRVLIARFKGWHERWMSYRYLAEQLRILRIGFPLMVMPESVKQRVWEPEANPEKEAHSPVRVIQPEGWILQRIVVAEGLPKSAAGKAYFRITHHNDAILQGVNHALADNRAYYQSKYHRLHKDHHRLHRFSLLLFALTFAAVLSHFVFHLPGILFFTAFFPAWGAAIHGILNQNEVGRISAISAQTWQRLTTLSQAMQMHQTITEAGVAINDQAIAWARTRELRELVRAFTDTLADENKQWVSLLQHNQPDLPA
ncbi:DUF4231 domain-containing protein [Salinispirillum sp. LH 10-3-1]|uniref:DUF4231 domain-containing protein n=1 Tax=Salinispirillum sp. LH 10-3-1 TaxID=2952525 RepID=A0AB38YIE3_9GAMM